jgi:peptide/nickel transport system permease protein
VVHFILRRLLYLVPVWLGISLVAFLLTNLTPGDPARLALQRELGRQPTAEETAAARDQMGLNDPAPVRYFTWLGDAVSGDLGTSYRTGTPVLDSLMERFPNTLQIAGIGLMLAVALAIPLGVLAAVYQRTPVDHLSRVLALLGASMPSYWIAYLLILLFSVRLGVLPVAGSQTWQHAVMPALTLGIGGSASLMRLARSETLETLGQDYIRTARAKGLRSPAILIRHALRNTMIPISTVLGMRFAGMLGGAVIVETIFSWPGVGKLMVDAIFDRDYPMIQGFVLFMGTAFLMINLIVDLGYGLIDPRMRLMGK